MSNHGRQISCYEIIGITELTKCQGALSIYSVLTQHLQSINSTGQVHHVLQGHLTTLPHYLGMYVCTCRLASLCYTHSHTQLYILYHVRYYVSVHSVCCKYWEGIFAAMYTQTFEVNSFIVQSFN